MIPLSATPMWSDFLKTAGQQGIGGNVHFLDSDRDLHAGSGPRSRRRADCGTFSSAGNRANDRTQQSAAADILGGRLMRTSRSLQTSAAHLSPAVNLGHISYTPR